MLLLLLCCRRPLGAAPWRRLPSPPLLAAPPATTRPAALRPRTWSSVAASAAPVANLAERIHHAHLSKTSLSNHTTQSAAGSFVSRPLLSTIARTARAQIGSAGPRPSSRADGLRLHGRPLRAVQGSQGKRQATAECAAARTCTALTSATAMISGSAAAAVPPFPFLPPRPLLTTSPLKGVPPLPWQAASSAGQQW